ncbi:spore coat protein [Desertibacillus haloalkaliphilus]|uniref:spore coat protein n=1 Tax=Desertibacillus haloalkaliphilus TaxID=1328930 RepID=UPI001C25D7A0|nr:spore coat protein [Desertibacillus haloalkaliphilus]MBU8906890.1 spore coat protein [Desertibacillus haloalkaliphilus]
MTTFSKFREAPTSRWCALDDKKHPLCDTDEQPTQEADQLNKTLQLSEELIHVKDSCDITVNTTDTKGALNLQAALQAAIALVINISIADSDRAERITQDLLQSSKIKQITRQKTLIENSRGVEVRTTDTQLAANIQILLQILLALLVNIDIL